MLSISIFIARLKDLKFACCAKNKVDLKSLRSTKVKKRDNIFFFFIYFNLNEGLHRKQYSSYN